MRKNKLTNSNDRRKKMHFRKEVQLNELGKTCIEYIIPRNDLWAKTNIKGIMALRTYSDIETS